MGIKLIPACCFSFICGMIFTLNQSDPTWIGLSNTILTKIWIWSKFGSTVTWIDHNEGQNACCLAYIGNIHYLDSNHFVHHCMYMCTACGWSVRCFEVWTTLQHTPSVEWSNGLDTTSIICHNSPQLHLHT